MRPLRVGVNRRTFLAAAGTAASAGLAGCLGGFGGTSPDSGDGAGDDTPDDGYPPRFDDVPAERTIDTASYGTTRRNGVDVPLAPIEDVHYWFRRREARFADARGQRAFEASHVLGAVSSPAGSDVAGTSEDPVSDWPEGDRVVCYCACPHHLSSIRAASLIDDGYEAVYVIDEGFGAWLDRDYAVAGERASLPPAWTVRGQAAPAHAGASAWARHAPTGQREATAIEADGSYVLELPFYDVGPESRVTVETPGYSVTASLESLADGVVDRSGDLRR